MKKKLLIGAYLTISLVLALVEYTGDSYTGLILYYSIVLANLANAVRLTNKKRAQ